MVWNVDPVLINIGLEIRYYGLLFAAGLFGCYFIFVKIALRNGWKKELPDKIFLYVAICLVLGAHFVHLIFYEPKSIIENPVRIIQLGMGLASHGGVLGALLGIYLFTRKYKKNFLETCDMIVASVGLTGAAIRFGNLFNSEIIGHPTDKPWGIIFKRATDPGIDVNVPRHPTQLYEALFLLLMFFVFYFLYKKYAQKLNKGILFFAFLGTYFAFRFFVEFFKLEQSDLFMQEPSFLTMGQWLSIPIVLFSGFMLFKLAREKKVTV